MELIWEKISSYITSDNIALLSVIITVLIFVLTRRAELRYKKHDDKKVQYLKLISLMEKTLAKVKKDKKGNIILTDEVKHQFFDTGSSLLLYGSKKIYRQYVFFRVFTTNPLIKQCKYYDDGLTLYIISDILLRMRKEVGLSRFNNIDDNEALAFFINDISNNPIAKEKASVARFKLKMIRFELFMIDRTQFIFLKSVYRKLIKPVFSGVSIIFKHIVIVPLGRLIIKLFPKFAEKVRKEQQQSE